MAAKPFKPFVMLPGDDEALLMKCAEVIRAEKKASVNLLQAQLQIGGGKATRMMEELERRGFVGPARGTSPREILGGDITAAAPAAALAASDGHRPPLQQIAGGGDGGNGNDGNDVEEENPENRELMAWREFRARLMRTDAHTDMIWEKRGIPKEIADGYGLYSAIKSNEEILLSLRETFTEDELVEYGLLRRGEDGKFRPQPQLCGYGNTGKKDERGQLMWEDNVCPVLISYFDRAGKWVDIRPHKGNVPGRRPRLYVVRFAEGWVPPLWFNPPPPPRDYKPTLCVITEGEFKAMALHFSTRGKLGVAAIPGISMATNFAVMEELKEWLLVDCRPERVIVAFDNEEKGNPRLPGYKADKRKRYDAEIWARYLAITLEKTCVREAAVCRLPDAWRDANGKADWDSAIARMMHGQLLP